MQIKILLFATLKDIAGQSKLDLTLPDDRGCRGAAGVERQIPRDEGEY